MPYYSDENKSNIAKINKKLDLFFPYFLPYFAFLGIRIIADYFQNGLYLGYIIAYASAALLLWKYRKKYHELHGGRIGFLAILGALIVGILGIIIWILPYHYIADFAKTDSIFGLAGASKKAVEPFLKGKIWFFPFIICRIVGNVFIVPIFEELFIRSFVWRYLINPDIRRVSVGEYTAFAFWGTAILFSISHTEWIVAFLYAIIINLFLIHKKDIRLCMVAHSVSNAILIGYVWKYEKWFLW